MEEFAYNNAKKTSIGHMSFLLNYKLYLYNFFKEDINSCSNV